jgi:hypothetical protein
VFHLPHQAGQGWFGGRRADDQQQLFLQVPEQLEDVQLQVPHDGPEQYMHFITNRRCAQIGGSPQAHPAADSGGKFPLSGHFPPEHRNTGTPEHRNTGTPERAGAATARRGRVVHMSDFGPHSSTGPTTTVPRWAASAG